MKAGLSFNKFKLKLKIFSQELNMIKQIKNIRLFTYPTKTKEPGVRYLKPCSRGW